MTKLGVLIVVGLLLLAGCENALLTKALTVKAQGESPVITVTDTGQGPVLSGGTVTFPDTSVSGSVQLNLTIANSGHTALAIDTNAIKLTMTNGEAGTFTLGTLPSQSIGVGSSATLPLTFKPTSVGAKTASVEIPSNDLANPRQVFTIKGNGVTGAKDIVAFGFKNPAVSGVITGTSIQVDVPIGTDLSLLVASFTTTGVAVLVNGNPQTSGTTSVDFSRGPVGYAVRADDSTVKTYTVSVTQVVMAPLLTTAAVGSITTTSALGGGNITNSGGASITERGVCWATTESPTTATSKFLSGTGIGDFSTNCLITGLSPGRIYYVRAFAINTVGTAYGAQVSFTTAPDVPGTPSVAALGAPTGSGQLTLSWSSGNGSSTLYDVYFSATTIAPSSPNGPTNLAANTCTMAGLTNFTPYYVWIVAKTASGTSAKSGTMGSPVPPGIHVTSVTLNKTTDNLNTFGPTDQLSATVLPANATDPSFTWSVTSGGAYASVNASGLISPNAGGTATIAATTTDLAKTGVCTVTVATGIKTLATGFNSPMGLAVDSGGNVYVADENNHRICKVASNGTVTIVAGDGTDGFSGDGSTALSAQLSYPRGVALDGAGNLYIAENGNHCIRKVNNSGVITTVAGTGGHGNQGFSGDGSLATAAKLYAPAGVAVNSAGTILYIADMLNHRIRKVTIGGNITTVAGTGTGAFNGDGTATSVQLNFPTGVALASDGSTLFITDDANSRIRKLSGGSITTVAGDGNHDTVSADGTLATAAHIYGPANVALDALGTTVYVADSGFNLVRKFLVGGTLSTYAGSGSVGYSGDGGPATSATLGEYHSGSTVGHFFGIAFDPTTSTTYISDTYNNCIRMVR